MEVVQDHPRSTLLVEELLLRLLEEEVEVERLLRVLDELEEVPQLLLCSWLLVGAWWHFLAGSAAIGCGALCEGISDGSSAVAGKLLAA